MTWQSDLIKEADIIWERGWGYVKWGITKSKEGPKVHLETHFSQMKVYKKKKEGTD